MNETNRKKKRINFEADEAVVHLIDELTDLTDSSQRAVLTASLLAFRWIVSRQVEGKKILAVDDDNSEKIQYDHGLAIRAVASSKH